MPRKSSERLTPVQFTPCAQGRDIPMLKLDIKIVVPPSFVTTKEQAYRHETWLPQRNMVSTTEHCNAGCSTLDARFFISLSTFSSENLIRVTACLPGSVLSCISYRNKFWNVSFFIWLIFTWNAIRKTNRKKQ